MKAKQANVNYRIRFVTQYFTYLNIWGALSKACQPMTFVLYLIDTLEKIDSGFLSGEIVLYISK